MGRLQGCTAEISLQENLRRGGYLADSLQLRRLQICGGVCSQGHALPRDIPSKVKGKSLHLVASDIQQQQKAEDPVGLLDSGSNTTLRNCSSLYAERHGWKAGSFERAQSWKEFCRRPRQAALPLGPYDQADLLVLASGVSGEKRYDRKIVAGPSGRITVQVCGDLKQGHSVCRREYRASENQFLDFGKKKTKHDCLTMGPQMTVTLEFPMMSWVL